MKRLGCSAFYIAALILATILGCSTKPPYSAPSSPVELASLRDLGTPHPLEGGVLQYEVALPRAKPTNHVWIYMPNVPGTAKLPCVLIAPAGSRLFHGM